MGFGWQEIDKTLDLGYIRGAGLHRECKPAVLFDPPNFLPRTMTHVCMYICSCMYVCTYAHVCMYVHMLMYVCMYICLCMYVLMLMYVCMYICSCMYVLTYAHVCMYAHMLMYVCTYAHVCMYVHMLMYVCTYADVCYSCTPFRHGTWEIDTRNTTRASPSWSTQVSVSHVPCLNGVQLTCTPWQQTVTFPRSTVVG